MPPQEEQSAQGRHDRARDRMLQAMLAATGEHGYKAVSVREVLERSGAARASFYRHWDNKEECFIEAHQAASTRLVDEILAAAAERERWRDGLAAGLCRLLQFVSAEPSAAKALTIDVYAVPGAIEGHYRQLERLARAIDGARAELPEDSSPPERTAQIIVGGLEQVLSGELMDKTCESVWRLLPQLMYFVVLPYFGRQVAQTEFASAPLAPTPEGARTKIERLEQELAGDLPCEPVNEADDAAGNAGDGAPR